MEKGKFYSGLFIMTGLIILGMMIPKAVKDYRSFDRTVNVKGLCEKEVKYEGLNEIKPGMIKTANHTSVTYYLNR